MKTGGEAVEVGEQHVVALAVMPQAGVLVLETGGQGVFVAFVQHRVGSENGVGAEGVDVVQEFVEFLAAGKFGVLHFHLAHAIDGAVFVDPKPWVVRRDAPILAAFPGSIDRIAHCHAAFPSRNAEVVEVIFPVVEGDLRVVATIRIEKIAWARAKDLAGESVGSEQVF